MNVLISKIYNLSNLQEKMCTRLMCQEMNRSARAVNSVSNDDDDDATYSDDHYE